MTPTVRRQEMRYGSGEFLAASNWARRLPDVRARTVLANLARHPAVVRALAAVWRLPIIDLRVRKCDADAWWFGHWFGPRRLGRLGRAVLELPGDEAGYLAGHPRRILRNKLGHARAAGVTSARVGYDTWAKAAADVLRARGEEPGPDTARHPRPAAYYVAWDGCGTPLAYASVALFDQFAVLFLHVSRPDRRPEASWARYQLHTCLALDLGSCGVRHLLTGSALREPTGIQYFQHVLGYQVRNLRVELVLPADRPDRGPAGAVRADPRPVPCHARTRDVRRLRFGELAARRRSDIDLERVTVRVTRSLVQVNSGTLVEDTPKSRAGRRIVAFPHEIVPELRWHLKRLAEPARTACCSSARRASVCAGPTSASYGSRRAM